MEYCVSEVETNEEIENIFEKWLFTFRYIVKEKGKREVTDGHNKLILILVAINVTLCIDLRLVCSDT